MPLASLPIALTRTTFVIVLTMFLDYFIAKHFAIELIQCLRVEHNLPSLRNVLLLKPSELRVLAEHLSAVLDVVFGISWLALVCKRAWIAQIFGRGCHQVVAAGLPSV